MQYYFQEKQYISKISYIRLQFLNILIYLFMLVLIHIFLINLRVYDRYRWDWLRCVNGYNIFTNYSTLSISEKRHSQSKASETVKIQYKKTFHPIFYSYYIFLVENILLYSLNRVDNIWLYSLNWVFPND